jgi:hypothetical protein
MLPLHNLLIGVVRRFRAEGWITNKAFKHDGAERPPIAFVTYACLSHIRSRESTCLLP